MCSRNAVQAMPSVSRTAGEDASCGGGGEADVGDEDGGAGRGFEVEQVERGVARRDPGHDRHDPAGVGDADRLGQLEQAEHGSGLSCRGSRWKGPERCPAEPRVAARQAR